jgi:hypothetical protein
MELLQTMRLFSRLAELQSFTKVADDLAPVPRTAEID